jgi:hypothetical protein
VSSACWYAGLCPVPIDIDAVAVDALIWGKPPGVSHALSVSQDVPVSRLGHFFSFSSNACKDHSACRLIISSVSFFGIELPKLDGSLGATGG